MPSPIPEPVRALLASQDDVVSRAQLLRTAPAWQVRRWIERGALVPVHPGVYVAHNGPTTWQQRAWAAVLVTWPAALHGVSALRAADGPGRRRHDDAGPIHVAVGRDRALAPRPGVRVHRLARLDQGVQWNLGPPRQCYEEASLTVALLEPRRIDGIAVLAAGVQNRRTVARRLAENLASRPRVADRAFWRGILEDVAAGSCSVLERGYLERVERAHGLPVFDRQVRERTPSGVVYRDAALGGVVIELDGRLHHDSASSRDRDMERDLDAAVDGLVTLRLSYGQVYDRACATARRISAVLRDRGWSGRPRACGVGCDLADRAA
ncbi:hypothetical protein RDV89_11310 [Nocardioides zeae]|uniref:DUF559 domain-containing protein n=1 Tax=Nocardioides imazamoxiresistens TaxID=3231893 RepID=A0ABU3PWP0_9ACTN|nr:hypothetical protein [Nocardioides zeae]MDT9593658.1 hypothetical protein [Nocardioides zeae]